MISGDEFVRAFRKIGYELDHTEGSHMILLHPSRRRLSVPRIENSAEASLAG
jgi:predicted RNA binding protein YcfA (HicA-like mRNA interferase family)